MTHSSIGKLWVVPFALVLMSASLSMPADPRDRDNYVTLCWGESYVKTVVIDPTDFGTIKFWAEYECADSGEELAEEYLRDHPDVVEQYQKLMSSDSATLPGNSRDE